MPIVIQGEAPNGGSMPAVASETVTVTLNEANNWTAAHAVDMGSGGVLVGYSAVLTATTPDGETFGTGPGELGVDSTLGFSLDGNSYGGTAGRLTSGEVLDANFYMSTVSQSFGEAWARFARSLHSIRAEETDSVYAGPNSPIATVAATLIWLPGDPA